jgi:CelD/BcsL family acetyltransferase involved in cellulose biosynthesis
MHEIRGRAAFDHVDPSIVGLSAKNSVDVITTLSGFDALEKEWGELFELFGTTPFQSFAWQRTWWKHFGEQNRGAWLHIVTIRNLGRLVGIAPLFVESMNRMGFIRLRRLAFIGRETTDYLDVIAAEGHERDCAALLAAYVYVANKASLFDLVHLVDMSGNSVHHTLLHKELSRQGFNGHYFVNEYCPRTRLQHTWQGTLSSLPSSKRASLKRVQRKIESDFRVTLHVVNDPDKLPEDFTQFVDLHQRRWNGSGHLGVFGDTRTTSFHREVSEISLKRKWLFLAFLELDGKRIAGNYGFVFRNKLFYYLSGIEMHGDLSKYSLGRVLHLFSIQEAIRQGVEVYDFMRGTERYKYDFNSVDVPNWTILMYASRFGLVRQKFNIVLLIDSMKRRIARERLLWSQVSSEQRAVSGGLMCHIARRIQTNLRDGLRKLRSPEKSLSTPELTAEPPQVPNKAGVQEPPAAVVVGGSPEAAH